MARRGIRFAVFLTLLLLYCRIPATAESREKSITVMVYMTGSNLESQYGSASADLREMENAGFDADRIHLLVMAGGARNWQYAISGEETVIFSYFSRRGETHSVTVRRETGVNMGDPDSLSGFLQFGTENYPADEYALILWDHGAGPVNGICWDEQNDGDHLTLGELTEALQKSPFQSRKLAWIGFDACLMGSLEVAGKLAPYAEYMIASQAEEPATGWNYAFLKGLEQDENGAETGKRVVDAYFEVPSAHEEDLTLACIDLSATRGIEEGMNRMYRNLASRMNRETFLRLAALRRTATDFGRDVSDASGSSGYDLVDLMSLNGCFAEEDPEETARIEAAVRQAVVCSRANLEGCCGLSVYHPFRNSGRFLSEWNEEYAGLDFCPGYTAYVNAYGKMMSGARLVLLNHLTDLRCADSLITLNLSEKQAEYLASARLVVLARNPFDYADEAYFRVFSTAEVELHGTQLSAVYGGTCLQALNASGFEALTGAISYRVTEDGEYVVPLYPYEADGRRAEQPILAEYTMDPSGRLRLKGYAVADEMTGMLSRRTGVDLSGYAGVTFRNEYRNPVRNADGEMLAFDDWAEDPHPDTQWRARYDADRTDFMLSFALDSSRAEALYAAFELTDAQGNTRMSELIPLDQGGAVTYETGNSLTLRIPEPVTLSESVVLRPAETAENSRLIVSVVLANGTQEDLSFLLNGVRLNGIPVSAEAVSTAGSGRKNPYTGKRSIAPGEKGSASLVLKYEDLKAVFPEVSLRDISCQFTLFAAGEGNTLSSAGTELSMRTEIPLDAFYQDAEMLPPQELVEAARQYGAIDPSTEKTLFSLSGCRTALQGTYILDGRMVLLLEAENRNASAWSLYLGQASTDGKPAVLGQTRNPWMEMLDNRRKSHGLEPLEGGEERGAAIRLEAGEKKSFYVSVVPADKNQTEVYELAFHAFLYDTEQPLEYVYTDEIRISTEEPAPLQEGIMAVASAEDYRIREGQAAQPEPGGTLSRDAFPLPEDRAEPFRLELIPEEGERIADGCAVLLRKVSSDEELAEMNILNRGDQGGIAASFANGKTWLIYEASLPLTAAEDGAAATALFHGFRPVIVTESGRMPMRVSLTVSQNAEGLTLMQTGNHLSFSSSAFPGATLGWMVGSLELRLTPETGTGGVTDYRQVHGDMASLAGCVFQKTALIPADSGEAEMTAFLNGGSGGLSLYQLLPMGGEQIRLSAETIRDPGNYEVVFLYLTTDGNVRTTAPRNLAAMMR